MTDKNLRLLIGLFLVVLFVVFIPKQEGGTRLIISAQNEKQDGLRQFGVSMSITMAAPVQDVKKPGIGLNRT